MGDNVFSEPKMQFAATWINFARIKHILGRDEDRIQELWPLDSEIPRRGNEACRVSRSSRGETARTELRELECDGGGRGKERE